MMQEWGFDKFIPQAYFKDPANGYLVDDTCVFGAEVYVCQDRLTTGRGECLSMLKDTITYKNTLKFENIFDSTNDTYIDSKPFNISDKPWQVGKILIISFHQ